jgi:hypothetical protein
MKDTKAILLLLVTLGLVSTWAYHIYDKNKYSNQVAAKSAVVDSVAIQNTINDSLRKMFGRTLKDLGVTNTNKEAYSTELASKVNEIDSLRNEITTILNVANITREDLRRAELKIIELQKKMISSAKNGITYTKEKQEPLPNNFVQEPSLQAEQNQTNRIAKKEIAVTNDEAAFLIASDVSLKAVQQDDRATNKASLVNYFAVSCQLKNQKSSFTNTDVYIVLTDPQGNVIQDDQWQAGMFSSRDGRIAYTRKNSFEYTRGDSKRMLLTVKLPDVNPGAYHVQLYHNGNRIGKADIKLN